MIYKTKSFDNIYRLSEFLNDNKINPTDIVGIYREYKYQNQYTYKLLYIEPDKYKRCLSYADNPTLNSAT